MAASARAVRAGKAVVELGVDDRFTKSLKSISAKFNAMGGQIRNVGLGVAAIGGAAVAGLGVAFKQFVNVGDAMEEMAQRTGFSTEALSEMELAANSTGASLEAVEIAARKMTKTIDDAATGGKAGAETLRRLGLTAEKLRGMSMDDQFAAVAEGLANVENEGERAALALEIFGKSGTKLLPMLAGGAAGLAEWRSKAAALGLTIGKDTAAAAGRLADVFDALKLVVRAMAVQIGGAIGPQMESLGKAIVRIAGNVNRWIAANKPLVVTFAKIAAIVTGAGLAITALGLSLSAAGVVAGGLATGFAAIVAVGKGLLVVFGFLASPLGIVIGLVAAATGAFLAFTDTGNAVAAGLVDSFKKLRKFVGESIGGMADALAAGDLSLAADVLWKSLVVAWETGTNRLEIIFAESLGKILGFMVDFKFAMLTLWNSAMEAIEPVIHETVGFFARAIIKAQAKLQGWSDQMLADAMMAESVNRNADKAAGQRSRAASAEEIAKAHVEAAAAIKKGTDDRIAGAEAEKKAAEDALVAALKAAKAARKAAEEGGPTFGGGKKPSFGDVGAGIQKNIVTAGTFDTSRLGGLFGGNEAMRTAKATEETAKTVRELADTARRRGLVWG